MTLVASASASSNVIRAPFKVAPQAGAMLKAAARRA
jgi:hypothetical protein